MPIIERRAWGAVEVRAEGEDEDAKKKPKKITGYAAVFGVTSDDLGGFREIVKAGAFDRALDEEHDVRALINHNPDLIIGRTKAGTLNLTVDDHGLAVEITPPDTQAARDLMASIARGDISQMSFAFQTLTDDWRMEDGEPVRELKDLILFDVSPVAFPAYPQTEVDARAVDRARALRARVEGGVAMDINERQARLDSVA